MRPLRISPRTTVKVLGVSIEIIQEPAFGDGPTQMVTIGPEAAKALLPILIRFTEKTSG